MRGKEEARANKAAARFCYLQEEAERIGLGRAWEDHHTGRAAHSLVAVVVVLRVVAVVYIIVSRLAHIHGSPSHHNTISTHSSSSCGASCAPPCAAAGARGQRRAGATRSARSSCRRRCRRESGARGLRSWQL